LFLIDVDKNDDKNAVKMRGLPFRVKYDEIMEYFNEFNPIEKSAIL
jgi:hypothetical protein